MGYKMITFMLIGLIVSAGLIYADDRGIVIDAIVSDLGVPAWELAFGTYLGFLVLGVAVDMVTTRTGRKYGFAKEGWQIILVCLLFVFSLWVLEESAISSLQTDFNSMVSEFVNWGFYYALIIGAYIFNKVVITD